MALNIVKPAVGGSTGTWGTELNTALDAIVTAVNGVAGIPANTVTTKGDLIVGTGASAVTRVGVGANGTVPVADSNQASGIGWKIPPGTLVLKAGKTAAQSISYNTGQPILFDNIIYNNTAAGFASAGASFTSYTPGVAGWYEVSGGASFADISESGTPRAAWVVSNGVEVDTSAGSVAAVNGYATVAAIRTTAIQLTSTQAVAIFAYQARTSGAALSLYLSGKLMSSMTVKWLGT